MLPEKIFEQMTTLNLNPEQAIGVSNYNKISR